jgi:DNA-binding IclR family transcriptional regulator
MGKTPSPGGANLDRYMVPGLVRGLEVLQAFTPQRPYLTLRDLAEATGVTRSAVFRIAYTLSELGFLVQDTAKRQYALGPAVLRLGYGYLAPRGLVEAALGPLEALRDAVGWSAHLGILDGTDVVYLLRAPTRRGLASIVHVGSRLPAHSTSMGRVLLSQLSEAEIVSLYRGVRLGIARGHGHGPATVADLVAQARRGAESGYVVHLGEFQQGVASVAAPLRDASGRVVAAINIASAWAREADARPDESVIRGVLDAALSISRALGFEGGPER